jgi:hypothetical protein
MFTWFDLAISGVGHYTPGSSFIGRLFYEDYLFEVFEV